MRDSKDSSGNHNNFNVRSSINRIRQLQKDVNKQPVVNEELTGDSVYSAIDDISISVDDNVVPRKLSVIYQIFTTTDDFINRNSLLGTLVFLWSAFNFPVYIRNDHDADIFWACSTLISGTGALMNVVLLSRKEMHYSSVISTIIVLLFAFFLLIAAGILWVETKRDDSMSCGSLWFAQGVLMPSFCLIIIAVDLMKGYFENTRARILAYSGAIIISGMTFCISYFGQDQDSMKYSDKCTEAGFVIVCQIYMIFECLCPNAWLCEYIVDG